MAWRLENILQKYVAQKRGLTGRALLHYGDCIMTVKDRVIFVPRGPRGLRGETGVQGNSSAETSRIDSIENQSSINDVYVSAGGNDLNEGTLSLPVRTFDRVFELLKSSTRNRIYLMSDVTCEHNLLLYTVSNVLILKHSSLANNPKLTIRDAVNHQNTTGRINIRGPVSMAFQQVDLVIDTTRTGPFLYSNSYGSVNVWFWACTVESLANSNGTLLGNIYAGDIRAYFQSIPMINMEGKIFHGVAAGVDPNTRFGVATNLTSG